MTPSADRIQELLDRADLTDLVVGIGRCIDTGDFDGLARIYTADARLELPGTMASGATAVIEAARRGHETFARTQHLIAGTAVELSGDRAGVVANVIAALVAEGAEAEVRLLGSRYEFAAVRTTDGWRFAEHVITPVWARPGP